LIEAGCQRFGFTKAQALNNGGSIIESTDTLLGRSWDPVRLRRWNALVADSMFGTRVAPERSAAGRRTDNCRQVAQPGLLPMQSAGS
jgi:hypothetical protein